MHPAILVMGVSASGKTTLGEGLAEQLGAAFVEGDDLHSHTSVEKMSRGEPLGDADRWPWLDAVAKAVALKRESQPVVFACSALKRSYRDRLRDGLPAMRIVYPDISRELAGERISQRKGHFMPPSLIDSQFAALEPPTAEERAIRVSAHQSPEEMIDEAARAFTG